MIDTLTNDDFATLRMIARGETPEVVSVALLLSGYLRLSRQWNCLELSARGVAASQADSEVENGRDRLR